MFYNSLCPVFNTLFLFLIHSFNSFVSRRNFTSEVIEFFIEGQTSSSMAQSARHRKFNERPTSENPCALRRVASTGRDDFVRIINDEKLRRSVRSIVDGLIGRRTIRRARRIFWKIIYTDSYWSVSKIHVIFGRYLLLYYYLSKVEYLRSGFVRLLCFERDIKRGNVSVRAIFFALPCNGMYSVYVRASVYDGRMCACAKES